MAERLDKVISNTTLQSRTVCKALIRNGAVSVNGVPVKTPEFHVDTGKDTIAVNGEPLSPRRFFYIMMNKPRGYLSATEDRYERTVLDLLPGEYGKCGLSPAGRLDRDTEGFLLLTNDGETAHRLMSPKHHAEKTYFVRVTGMLTDEHVRAIAQGLRIDGYTCLPAELKIVQKGENSEAFLTIREGKFHQIKRMMYFCGCEVTYLCRMSIAGVQLDPALAPGAWRFLTDAEERAVRDAGKR